MVRYGKLSNIVPIIPYHLVHYGLWLQVWYGVAWHGIVLNCRVCQGMVWRLQYIVIWSMVWRCSMISCGCSVVSCEGGAVWYDVRWVHCSMM